MQTQLNVKSISGQKIKVYTKLLQADENFWHAFLVFIGALSVLSAIPFYPVLSVPMILDPGAIFSGNFATLELPFIAFLLALLCGAIAYRNPPLGTIVGAVLAFPAFAYQSYSLGFLFILVLAIIFFEAFEHWAIISALGVLVFLPFTPFPLSLLGGFVMLGMMISALHFGSSKSFLVSIPSVFLILFLSSIWNYNSLFIEEANAAYMPITSHIYEKPAVLQVTKKPVDIFELPMEFVKALASLFDFAKASEFSIAISASMNNIFRLMVQDSALIQLAAWAFVLYMVSFVSGRIKSKRSQLISSLFLLIIPVVDFLLSLIFSYQIRLQVAIYAILSIAIIGMLEHFNIQFSQESTIMKKEKLKQFGKFGVRDLSLESSERFDDIGGYEDVKNEIRDAVILPLEKKELAYAYGLTPAKGILLFGPPGTGKTMLIRALANEINFRLYYVNTSELLSKWYGESEKNVAELFADARKNAPCIIMFDEIDAIGKNRTLYSDDVTPRVLSTLLQEIDGAIQNPAKPIVIIGTTNVPHLLDPALLRPGRFDKIIYMPLPDYEARKEIFRVHLKKYPSSQIDLDILAKKSNRFSGADIKHVIDEAVKSVAKRAEREDRVIPLTTEDLLKVLAVTKPSVGLASLEEYERFKLDFERRMGREIQKKSEEEKETEVRWSDVVGLDEVRASLLEAIEIPLLHEELMKEYKIKPSKGILLFGPPGCGKTLIVRAASNELKAAFITLSGAELMKKGYSQAVSVLKEAFIRAKENTPAILFIDEIETIAPSRTLGGGDVVGQLLTEMDGIKELKGVVIIGATNRPEMLDPAILRPGRFDKIFYIPPPDFEARKQIFQLNLGKFAEGVNLDLLAQATEGFSGADIASIVQSAKMNALKERISGKEPKITTQQLLAIIKQRRPSITEEMLEDYRRFMREYGERK